MRLKKINISEIGEFKPDFNLFEIVGQVYRKNSIWYKINIFGSLYEILVTFALVKEDDDSREFSMRVDFNIFGATDNIRTNKKEHFDILNSVMALSYKTLKNFNGIIKNSGKKDYLVRIIIDAVKDSKDIKKGYNQRLKIYSKYVLSALEKFGISNLKSATKSKELTEDTLSTITFDRLELPMK